ncbi:MAG: MFS transporter [Bryobacteraceae bacterium]|nr:MFS transporter [Bryobacteraceae bacterium]
MASPEPGASTPSATASSSPARLPRSRFLVVASIFLLSWILYIDRAAISSAKAAIASELGLSDQAMGGVFSAFILGYALMQIPGGWFADRFGPRLALAAMVSLWSLFTFLTGTVHTLGPLLVVRFLFGVGEAGAFPGSARTFYNWLPAGERGIANGILFSGAMIGGGISYPICAWLLGMVGWRNMFFLLAAPGFLWALLWAIFFRNHPAQPVAKEEAAIGAPRMPLSQIFRSGPLLLAMAQYFAGNFTFYIGVTWMLPYLTEHYRLTPSQAANYAMVPLICGALSNWTAGLIVDFLYRAGFHAWSRRFPGILGFLLAAIGIWSVSLAESPFTAVVGFAIAIFGVELTISPSWSYCMDIGGKSSGSVSGAMNMVGNLGGFVSSNAFPFLSRITGSASAYFYAAALLNLAGAACWVQMRPRKPQS